MRYTHTYASLILLCESGLQYVGLILPKAVHIYASLSTTSLVGNWQVNIPAASRR